MSASFSAVILKTTELALAFGLSLVITRLVGVEHYGAYSLIVVIVTLLSMLAQWGIPQWLLRALSWDPHQAWPLLRSGVQVVTYSTIGLAILVLGISGLLWTIGYGNHTVALGIAGLLIPFWAWIHVWGGALRGLQHTLLGLATERVLGPALLLVAVTGWLFYRNFSGDATESISVPALITLQLLISGIVCGIGLLVLRHFLQQKKDHLWQSTSNYSALDLWRASTPFAVILVLHLTNSQMDLLVLALFTDAETLGIYRATYDLALLSLIGLQALNPILQPIFARFYSQGQWTDLKHLFQKSALLGGLLALPVSGAMILFGDWLLSHSYGPAFSAGGLALAILSGGHLVNSAAGSVAVVLNMSGREQETIRALGFAALLNTGLNIALVPHYGMAGAATASALAVVSWNTFLWLRVQHLLQQHATPCTSSS